MSATTATRLSPAFADPTAVVDLIRSAGPFWPLTNYAGNDAEMAALGSRPPQFSPPWFRQDFVREGDVAVDGAELILDNPNFRDAAAAVYGQGAIVRPSHVYVNIMGPTPFPFIPHLDVPAFRGFTRADQPIWLLKVMANAGLFEQWRTKIATAVSWFYDGIGGDFHYWPDGADGPHMMESPPFRNVSIVADNESTFHGVSPLGAPGSTMAEGVDSHSRLVRGEGGWDILDGSGSTIGHIADEEARITVSWKADVFLDAEEARKVDEGIDTLDLDRIVDIFMADLSARGIDVTRPTDPIRDEAFVALIAATYPEHPPKMN